MAASNFSEIMKEEANKLAGKTKEEPAVLPTQNKKNKHTEDSRKELREKESKQKIEEKNWERRKTGQRERK